MRVGRTARILLIAVAIFMLAATPGVMESYLAWHQYPETRSVIRGWYAAIAIMAIILAATVGFVE